MKVVVMPAKLSVVIARESGQSSTLGSPVMAGLVPAIYAFVLGDALRRGCPLSRA